MSANNMFKMVFVLMLVHTRSFRFRKVEVLKEVPLWKCGARRNFKHGY
jgi:hypothetical protein